MRARPILVLALVVGAASADAQSLQNVVLRNSFTPVGAGARGSGMGGAFIAVADDGTAASFNPAGLAQLRRTELVLVGFDSTLASDVVRGSDLFRDPQERTGHAAIDFAGLALPFEVGRRRLTVQLAYQRAVDFFGRGRSSISFPITAERVPGLDSSLDAEYFLDSGSDQSGALHAGSVAAALDVAGPLLVGASLNVWRGAWNATGDQEGRLRVQGGALPAPRNLPDLSEQFEQSHRLTGASVNLGVLLRGAKVRLGGVVRMPFVGSYHVEENNLTTFYGAGAPESPVLDLRSMRTTLRWPRSAGIGVAVRPATRLTVAADYVHTQWSRTVVENVPNGALLTQPVDDSSGAPLPDLYLDRNFFDLFPASQSLTRDSGQWRGGAEYLLAWPRVVVPLRAGVFLERSPVPDLLTLGGRRIRGVTLGSGVNWNRVVVDMAWERRTSNSAIGARLSEDFVTTLGTSATEEVTHDRFVASLILRFGQTGGDDPIGRWLRRAFGGSDSK